MGIETRRKKVRDYVLENFSKLGVRKIGKRPNSKTLVSGAPADLGFLDYKDEELVGILLRPKALREIIKKQGLEKTYLIPSLIYSGDLYRSGLRLDNGYDCFGFLVHRQIEVFRLSQALLQEIKEALEEPKGFFDWLLYLIKGFCK